MGNLYCDLHSHTTNSDGVASVEELIGLAKAANIGVLAITDHDSYDERIEELKKTETEITLVTGAEFSMYYRAPGKPKATVHIIGLFIDYKNEKIQKMFHESRANQTAYVKAILKALAEKDMVITYEELLAANPDRKVLGRIPIARLMMQKGFPGCETVYQAMDNWIGSRGLRKCYVEGHKYMNFPNMEDGIAAIREAGGIAVLCHPYYYKLGDEGMEELIKCFQSYAGDAGAMEVFYKDYSEEERAVLSCLAEKYNLLPSAGSDYHGQDPSEYLDHKFSIDVYEGLLMRKKQLDLAKKNSCSQIKPPASRSKNTKAFLNLSGDKL